MLNMLYDYIPDSLPRETPFDTNPNLERKADRAGRLLPYRGNTVVFLLEDGVQERLDRLRDELYRAAPEMLAEKLDRSTFHMTVHDLVSGGGDGLEDRMAQAAAGAREVLRREQGGGPILMRATWMFNMVHTSVVLGLAPRDGESERRLDRLYEALEAVVPLGYPLTPHITLAYYRPGVYDRETVSHLRAALGPVELEVPLLPENLALQEFTDMNSYHTLAWEAKEKRL